MTLIQKYREAVAEGALQADAGQDNAAHKLQALGRALKRYRAWHWLFAKPPRGLYIWGDVGRGKSMLMDLFFAEVALKAKRRVHFNEFMVEVHARIHAERQSSGADPIAPVARAITAEAWLLCFDEFQVSDVADALILGRLFEQFFRRGVAVVATSNTRADLLYEGGLNRSLFLPFIDLIKRKLESVELSGPVDYRLHRMTGLRVYLTPLGEESDAAMDAAWHQLTDLAQGEPMTLTVLGRTLSVPQAAKGVARFSFADLCARPLAAADYLAVARSFHTILIDRIPQMTASMRDEARRFTVLIDTLYDQGVKLVCSAEVEPERLYLTGDGTAGFRRTVSRLIEMQSRDYLERGHGLPVREQRAAVMS